VALQTVEQVIALRFASGSADLPAGRQAAGERFVLARAEGLDSAAA
jgi:hypothetical protein